MCPNQDASISFILPQIRVEKEMTVAANFMWVLRFCASGFAFTHALPSFGILTKGMADEWVEIYAQ